MAISQFKDKTLTFLSFESLGTKEKRWFSVKGEKDTKYLLKISRQGTGEHWSEYIAYRLCQILQIPSAKYEILPVKSRDGKSTLMAVVSENLVENGYQMVMGNQFLYDQSPLIYDPPDKTTDKRYSNHTIAHIKQSLKNVHIKPQWGFPLDFTAFDVFCGYLLLDTLISNQDRHHENWAVLYHEETKKYYLCETYDHAASLGRELSEEKRKTYLTSKDKGQQIEAFVRRARSEIFENSTDKRPMLTIDALQLALSYQPIKTKYYWLNKVEYLELGSIEDILKEIPKGIMTEDTKKFVFEMIKANKDRIITNVT